MTQDLFSDLHLTFPLRAFLVAFPASACNHRPHSWSFDRVVLLACLPATNLASFCFLIEFIKSDNDIHNDFTLQFGHFHKCQTYKHQIPRLVESLFVFLRCLISPANNMGNVLDLQRPVSGGISPGRVVMPPLSEVVAIEDRPSVRSLHSVDDATSGGGAEGREDSIVGRPPGDEELESKRTITLSSDDEGDERVPSTVPRRRIPVHSPVDLLNVTDDEEEKRTCCDTVTLVIRD